MNPIASPTSRLDEILSTSMMVPFCPVTELAAAPTVIEPTPELASAPAPNQMISPSTNPVVPIPALPYPG